MSTAVYEQGTTSDGTRVTVRGQHTERRLWPTQRVDTTEVITEKPGRVQYTAIEPAESTDSVFAPMDAGNDGSLFVASEMQKPNHARRAKEAVNAIIFLGTMILLLAALAIILVYTLNFASGAANGYWSSIGILIAIIVLVLIGFGMFYLIERHASAARMRVKVLTSEDVMMPVAPLSQESPDQAKNLQ